MAVVNPAGFLQNAGATHTAEQMRGHFGLLTAGKQSSTSLVPRGGVHPALGNALQVTQTGSPSMAVIVKSGQAAIPGSEGAKQGIYSVLNDADVTLSISAAHATLNRIDLVCFKVEDSAYSGVPDTSSLVIVTGTPASSPSAPTAPNNSLTLATVSIVALDTSITNGEITDTRRYLAAVGGTINCTSTTRPAANTVADGQEIYEYDTNRTYITHDAGTTWNSATEMYVARNTLSGTVASITFSSIPSNIRRMRLLIRAKFSSGAPANSQIQINGNTGANYTYHQTGANDTSAMTPENVTGSTFGVAGVMSNGTFGVADIIFPSWDQTAELQWVFSASTRSGGSSYVRNGGGSFDVAGPYTSITIFPAGGVSYVSGSDFQLEGVYA